MASTSLNISVRPRRLPRSHLATPQLSVSLLHAAAQCVVHTVFQQLEAATEDAHAQRTGTGKKESEPDDEDDEENVALIMAQCAKILLDVANAHPAGMPMILR